MRVLRTFFWAALLAAGRELHEEVVLEELLVDLAPR